MEILQKTEVKQRKKMQGKLLQVSILCVFLIIIFSCNKENETESIKPFVTGIDIQKIVTKYLPDFDLVSKSTMYYEGIVYRFLRTSDNLGIYFTVGIYNSPEIAEKVAQEFFNNISAAFIEGSQVKFPLGDKFWYMGVPDSVINPINSVVFIRKNALIKISGDYNFGGVLTLAKKIDTDLINEADNIYLDKFIRLPIIFSITATKKILKQGETTRLTIHAADPYNSALSYLGSMGHYPADPDFIFTLTATHDRVGIPFFGSHKYTFIVVNERNIVSEIAEYEIFISE